MAPVRSARREGWPSRRRRRIASKLVGFVEDNPPTAGWGQPDSVLHNAEDELPANALFILSILLDLFCGVWGWVAGKARVVLTKTRAQLPGRQSLFDRDRRCLDGVRRIEHLWRHPFGAADRRNPSL